MKTKFYSNKLSKIVFSFFIALGGLLIAFIINYKILDKIIVTDICETDTSNLSHGYIFNLFYEISSSTGYHPEPSYFNFGFTVFLGLLVGSVIAHKLFWKNR